MTAPVTAPAAVSSAAASATVSLGDLLNSLLQTLQLLPSVLLALALLTWGFVNFFRRLGLSGWFGLIPAVLYFVAMNPVLNMQSLAMILFIAGAWVVAFIDWPNHPTVVQPTAKPTPPPAEKV